MDAIENPSQTIFHLFPQPADPSAINLSPSPPTVLCNSLYVADIPVTESISNIRSFIHSPSQIAAARNLRGEDAQRLIDRIDQALTLPELNGNLRRQCLHLLYKICKACELLPASYVLRKELICVGDIRSYGGSADVSEGECLGRRVAIKNLRFGTGDAIDKIFKRFCREIIGWKRLSHPNILPLLGVSVSTNRRCFRIVSDWMRNGNVMEYTRSNPEANRLQLLSEVMSGAAYLHEFGVVHGDLKGANILIDDSGTACLADFGLMKLSIDLSSIPLSETPVTLAGTPCWMSPELLSGEGAPPTRESDCYALGMVIYEVLTGLRPFHDLGTYAVISVVQRGGRPRRPPDAVTLGFSDALWRLVRMCWSKSPSDRPTAQQLLRCLEDASHTWVPPLEYPIPDGRGGGGGVNFTFGGEEGMLVGTLTRGLRLFASAASILYDLSLPRT